jgi:hypothetical protein
VKLVYYHNPFDVVSDNTKNYLFVNGVYPMIISRGTVSDDGAFWISYLPTIIICSDDQKTEYARIEDFTKITPTSALWMQSQDYTKTIDPTTIPDGVKVKGVNA